MVRRVHLGCMLLAAVCVLVAGFSVWGSPSRLSKIPTTNTAPKETGVLQTRSNFAENALTQQFVEFKTSLARNLEAGIDETVVFRGRNLQLEADAIQTNDQSDMLYSVGFLYDPGRRGPTADEAIDPDLGTSITYFLKDIVPEAWTSTPDTGAEEAHTFKLSYVFKF